MRVEREAGLALGSRLSTLRIDLSPVLSCRRGAASSSPQPPLVPRLRASLFSLSFSAPKGRYYPAGTPCRFSIPISRGIEREREREHLSAIVCGSVYVCTKPPTNERTNPRRGRRYKTRASVAGGIYVISLFLFSFSLSFSLFRAPSRYSHIGIAMPSEGGVKGGRGGAGVAIFPDRRSYSKF